MPATATARPSLAVAPNDRFPTPRDCLPCPNATIRCSAHASPDRRASIAAAGELQALYPRHQWRLVCVDVGYDDVVNIAPSVWRCMQVPIRKIVFVKRCTSAAFLQIDLRSEIRMVPALTTMQKWCATLSVMQAVRGDRTGCGRRALWWTDLPG